MKRIFLIVFSAICFAMAFACPDAQAAPKKKVGYVNLTYETKDSFVIKSKLFYPAQEAEVYPVVVLLHSLGYSGEYWGNLVKSFIDSGVAVFVVDLRGHGASVYDSNFKIRSWRYYSDTTFAKYPQDITEILRYLASNYKNISTTKYAIVGADIGANTAILASEKLYAKPSCLVLISPSRNFKNLYTPISLANLGEIPVLSIASVSDRFSYGEVQQLKKFAQGEYEMKTYPSGGMGMLMLKANTSMTADIVNWVSEKLK